MSEKPTMRLVTPKSGAQPAPAPPGLRVELTLAKDGTFAVAIELDNASAMVPADTLGSLLTHMSALAVTLAKEGKA